MAPKRSRKHDDRDDTVLRRASDALVFLAVLILSALAVMAVAVIAPVALAASAIVGVVLGNKPAPRWRAVRAS